MKILPLLLLILTYYFYLVNDVTSLKHPYENTYLLRFNKSLGVIEDENSLLFLFQIWANGLIVKNFMWQFEYEGRRIRYCIVCLRIVTLIPFGYFCFGFISPSYDAQPGRATFLIRYRVDKWERGLITKQLKIQKRWTCKIT